MEKIILLGAATNSDNRGCLALTLGALNVLFHKYGMNKFTSVDCFSPKKIEMQEFIIDDEKINVKTVYCDKHDFYHAIIDIWGYLLFKKTNNNLVKSIAEADIVYNINQGDSFTDIYGVKRWLRIFIDSFIAILLKKHLIFFPQTIGPFNTLFGRFLSFIILKKCKKIFIRDKMAVNYLKSIGVKYEESFDLSVYMSPEKVDIEIPQNTVGINISGLLHYKTDLSNSDDFEKYDELIEKLVLKLLNENKNILLIPHTYNVQNPGYSDDLKACLDFIKNINSDKITVIDKDYTAPQLKYIISQCDFLIASRMHACFAALATSTPVVGVSYSYKFKGGFDQFNIPECVISAEGIKENEIEKIVVKILSFISEKESIKTKLQKVNSNRKNIELDD